LPKPLCAVVIGSRGREFGRTRDGGGRASDRHTLDILPHNGAVVTLLALCGASHRESYFDIVMVGIVGVVLALVAVIGLSTVLGSF
jgi:hypothetical protein